MLPLISVGVNKGTKQLKVIHYKYNNLNGCKLLILFYITYNVALCVKN